MICSVPGCEEHYACRLRAKDVGLARAITPNRIQNSKRVLTQHVSDPAWERGVAGEHRPGGGFMPYLDPDRNPMGVKERAERRHDVDEQVKRLKTDPTVFAAERTPSP